MSGKHLSDACLHPLAANAPVGSGESLAVLDSATQDCERTTGICFDWESLKTLTASTSRTAS
jgi:hypothetical protein